MFAKLMIALLVIGGLAPFTFLKDENGNPLMNFSDIKMPKTKVPDIDLPSLPISTSNIPEQDAEGTVYKWKDADGMWQFSSEKPKGTQFTSTIYDQNMNVIQAVQPKRAIEQKQVVAKQETTKNIGGLGSAYSPKKVEKLFDDANNLETLLNDRMKQQNDLLNNL